LIAAGSWENGSGLDSAQGSLGAAARICVMSQMQDAPTCKPRSELEAACCRTCASPTGRESKHFIMDQELN
jgi:hypothetical protein